VAPQNSYVSLNGAGETARHVVLAVQLEVFLIDMMPPRGSQGSGDQGHRLVHFTTKMCNFA
jgi:hypothetical protein